MSSNGADVVTGELGQQNGLVPNLRFPEFIGQPLHDVRLGDVTEEATTRNGNKLASALVMGVRKEDGIVPMEERLVAGDISRYKNVRKNWFAYNPMRLNIGSIARWQGDSDVLVSPDYVVFRCRTQSNPTSLLPAYLDHFRSSTQWDAFTNESGDGGVRIRIYYRDIARMRLLLPDVSEQQKIADCLSSIDGLIAAELDKFSALKAHKKGLMQQLFPAPGETTRQLRFPEFQDAGDWKVEPLGKVFDTASGGTPERKTKEYWGGGIPWITTSLVNSNIIYGADEFITTAGLKNSSAKLFPKNTVLIAMYGQGKTRGKAALLGIEAATNQACAAILPKENIDPTYVFLNLVSRYDELRALSNSGGQENLSQGLVCELPFPYPDDVVEQQRISAFLSSIDTLINGQGDKIDVLKAHKRGLMQQLFPVAEQV